MSQPDQDDQPQDEQTPGLEEEVRQDRSEGGDAQPAGSIAEREAVAADEDDLFEGDDED